MRTLECDSIGRTIQSTLQVDMKVISQDAITFRCESCIDEDPTPYEDYYYQFAVPEAVGLCPELVEINYTIPLFPGEATGMQLYIENLNRILAEQQALRDAELKAKLEGAKNNGTNAQAAFEDFLFLEDSDDGDGVSIDDIRDANFTEDDLPLPCKSCPNFWESVGNGWCKPLPGNNTCRECEGGVNFKGYTTADRVAWSLKNFVNWCGCEGAMCLNCESQCPDFWDPQPGGWCEAPPFYQGPCPNRVIIPGGSSFDKAMWSYQCEADWCGCGRCQISNRPRCVFDDRFRIIDFESFDAGLYSFMSKEGMAIYSPHLTERPLGIFDTAVERGPGIIDSPMDDVEYRDMGTPNP